MEDRKSSELPYESVQFLEFSIDNLINVIKSRELEEVGNVRKFFEMFELVGPQNCKMVELLGFKFAQKGLCLKFLAAP